MKRRPIYFSNIKSRHLACDHPGNYFVPIVERARHSVISIETRDRKAVRQSDFLFSFLFPPTEATSSQTNSAQRKWYGVMRKEI